jgi:putative IMPACT (imprinted ancient) family translation regulator
VSATKAEMLACIDRELKMRAKVYPNWIQLGRITHAKAKHELATMRAVRDAIAQHVPDDVEPQGGLFG